MNDGESYVTVQIDGAFRAMPEREARARGLYPPNELDRMVKQRLDNHSEQLAAINRSLSAVIQVAQNLHNHVELMHAHQENLIQRMAEVENILGYGPDSDMPPCVPCNGKGWAWDQSEQVPCPDCKGTGTVHVLPWERNAHMSDLAMHDIDGTETP